MRDLHSTKLVAILALMVGTIPPGLAAADQLKGQAVIDLFHQQWGITLQYPADQPVVISDASDVYGGQSTSGGRGALVLMQQGGHPCEYTMVFDRPPRSFAFNRSMLMAGPSGITHPVWTATAYDASGRTLDSVREDEIRSYANVPARRFTLNGPGIARIVFWGDDKGFDAFCNVLIDTVDEAE